MTAVHDFIVVGSGCTGAMAAQTLVESGASVAMLDVGRRDAVYKDLIPEQDFLSIRESDPGQHRYWLGDRFEGIPWSEVRVGAQLTPSRRHIVEDVERWLPLLSETFRPMESLAYGGLGCGWGLGSFVFSRPEIEALGLAEADLAEAYEVVARRIGISAARDDGAPYGLGSLQAIHPPLQMDDSIQALYNRYRRLKSRLNPLGFHVGQPPIAIVSEEHDGRSRYAYRDMDFWSDDGLSAYRPWITVDRLRRAERLQYFGDCLALSFREHEDRVEVRVRRTDGNEEAVFHAQRLVLAAGALGTARVVLRSMGDRPPRLPVISNPYCYIPGFHWRMLGRPLPRFKTSLCQLVIYYDPDGDGFDVTTANLYTYRSLLLHKLVKEAPLNMADGLAVMRALQSCFIIAGIHHPERPGEMKYLELAPDPGSPTGDRLNAAYNLTPAEQRAVHERNSSVCRALRMLGCLPIKRIDMDPGSSIHYAGTLPFNDDERPLTLGRDGRLHGTRRVYVVDGSGFRYLPAKGLTLTLMANAHRVARLCGDPASA